MCNGKGKVTEQDRKELKDMYEALKCEVEKYMDKEEPSKVKDFFNDTNNVMIDYFK